MKNAIFILHAIIALVLLSLAPVSGQGTNVPGVPPVPGVDCGKISYTQGSLIGAPAAVPPGASVVIVGTGVNNNGCEATANANGSFRINCPGIQPVQGNNFLVLVNGLEACYVASRAIGVVPPPPGNVLPPPGNVIARPNQPEACNDKISYRWAGASTGGSVCVGRPGAVPPGANVTVVDSQGNKAEGVANADGSFSIKCINLVGGVGATFTVLVNGRACTVTAVR